ncbi:hypothetical protein ES703_33950 [subsurface metagenome]
MGTDGAGADNHSLQDAVGVALQQASILVGAGVALVGVADDVFNLTFSLAARLPLPAGREAAAAPAPQPRLLDLFDNLLRGHLEEGFSQGGVAADGDIVFNIRRVNRAVSAEDIPCLLLVEGDVGLVGDGFAGRRVDVEQALDDPARHDGLVDNLLDVLGLDLLVENLLGFDDHQGASFAEAVAARFLERDLYLELAPFDFIQKGIDHRLGAGGTAGGTAADRYAGALGVALSHYGLAQAFQPFGAFHSFLQ